MTEADFPRGGAVVEKRKRDLSESKEGLFPRKSKQARKSEEKVDDFPEGHEPEKENLFEGIWKGPVSAECITEGVLGLGCVTEVRLTAVFMETADGEKVLLPVKEVGATCLAELKKGVELESLFPVGHVIPFKVMPKAKRKDVIKRKSKLLQKEVEKNTVTIDPSKVNAHLGASTLYPGLAIAAQVKSVEEKGYVLDVGFKKAAAFLPSSSLPKQFNVRIGQPLTVRVQSAASTRMIQVALADEKEPVADNELENVQLRSLMPGTVLLANPISSKPTGTYVDIGNGLYGWLPRAAMPLRLRVNIDLFVKPIRVVVLLCQQTSRLLALSAQPDVVAVSAPEKRRNFGGIGVGDVLRCRVAHVAPKLVTFEYLSKVNDEEEEDEDEEEKLAHGKTLQNVAIVANLAALDGGEKAGQKYAVGTEHSVRVLSLHSMQRTLRVTTKKEALKQTMVGWQDAVPGTKVQAEIKAVLPKGVAVKIFGNIRGFISPRFYADKPIASAEKHFIVGTKVQCRVLGADEAHKTVKLTARPSMVGDMGAVVCAATSEFIGKTVVGVVRFQMPKGGVLVELYNGTVGRLSQRECNKRKAIKVDDAVEVRVVSVNEERERIELAVAEAAVERTDVVLRAKPTLGLHVGKSCGATAVEWEERTVNAGARHIAANKKKIYSLAVDVHKEGEPVRALLPSFLLSDCLDSPLVDAATVKEVLPLHKLREHKLDTLPLGDQAGAHKVTTKRFLLEWAAERPLPSTFQDIHNKDVVAGVVTQRVGGKGYFVEIAGGCGQVALAPFHTVDEGTSGERALPVGTTVVGKIGLVDVEKRLISINLNMLGTLPRGSSTERLQLSRALLRSALREQHWLAELHSLPHIAQQDVATVLQILDGVCLMTMERRNGEGVVAAYARDVNYKEAAGADVKAGDKLRVLVVDYAWPRGDVEVVVLGPAEVGEKGGKKQQKGKEGKKEEKKLVLPRLVVVKRDFLVVLDRAATVGEEEEKQEGTGMKATKGKKAAVAGAEKLWLIVVPTRLHPNHVVITDDLPSISTPVTLSTDFVPEWFGPELFIGHREEDGKRLEELVTDRLQRVTAARAVKKEEGKEAGGTLLKRFGTYHGVVEKFAEVEKVEEIDEEEKVTDVSLVSATSEAETNEEKKQRNERQLHVLSAPVRLNGARGRLHVSELPRRFMVQGTQPLQAFLKEYAHRRVSCLVMDTLQITEKGDKKARLCEVTLNEEKMSEKNKCKRTIDYTIKYKVGQTVAVFYSRHNNRGQLIFDVNPLFTAVAEQQSPDQHFALGELRLAKIMSIDKAHKALHVQLIDASASAQPGEVYTARVKELENHEHKGLRAVLTLPNGETAIVYPTAAADDFASAAATLRARCATGRQAPIRLLHLTVGGQRKWLAALENRTEGKEGVTDPLIRSVDDVQEGETLRGFVISIGGEEKSRKRRHSGDAVVDNGEEEKGQTAVVQLAPGIETIVDVGDSVLSVGALVRVAVVDIHEGQLLAELEGEEEQNGKIEGGKLRKQRISKSEGEPQEKKKKQVKERVTLEDPGFDFAAEEFSMDALAELAGMSKASSSNDVQDVKEEEEDEEMEVDESDVKKEEEQPGKKKKSKKEKASEVAKDKALSAKEKRLADKDRDLESADDYARAVKGEPNSSDLWIQFMTHYMRAGNLQAARDTAERALKHINYREDAELFAVWCAYINLEVAFGDEESWSAVFKRACEAADTYKIHKHIAATLAANEKHEDADEVYEKMLKKYKGESEEVWLLYAEYLMSKEDREEDARALLKRALHTLPKIKHVSVMSRFAQLEYGAGDIEKGRNIFENLLATYPKRLDVWAVYIDLTIKHEDVEQARRMLERVTSLPLSAFKLRNFYKKWMELEKSKGDEKALHEVKMKAQRFLTAVEDALDKEGE